MYMIVCIMFSNTNTSECLPQYYVSTASNTDPIIIVYLSNGDNY